MTTELGNVKWTGGGLPSGAVVVVKNEAEGRQWRPLTPAEAAGATAEEEEAVGRMSLPVVRMMTTGLEARVTVYSGDQMAPDYWPAPWRTALQAVTARLAAAKAAAVAEADEEDATRRLEVAARRAAAAAGPWAAWGPSGASSAPPVGEDPAPEEGWEWARGMSPAHVRGTARARAVESWIRNGGVPPWEVDGE